MTTRRRVFHVMRHPEGGWQVKEQRATEPVGRYPTKDQAVKAARKLAKTCLPSQAIVHRENGTFEEEFTYGKDPYPPLG